jgi:hypothetical protein
MMSSVWTLRLNLRSALSMDSPSCSRISAKIYHLISPAWDIWSLARMIRLFALNAALQRRMMAAPYSRTVSLRPRCIMAAATAMQIEGCDSKEAGKISGLQVILCGGMRTRQRYLLGELFNRVQEFLTCDEALSRKQTGKCFDDLFCREIRGQCRNRWFFLNVTR